MNPNEVIEFYQDRVNEYSTRVTEANQRIQRIAYARLGSIALSAGLIYAGFKLDGLFFIAALFFVVVFFYFIKKHTVAFHQRTLLLELLHLNEKEIAFQQGDKTVFDAGLDFEIEANTAHHLYSRDLDIFGIGSLFQSINRSATRSGRKLLSQLLLSPLTDQKEINTRRDSIFALRDETQWRQDFFAIGAQIEEKPTDHNEINSWLALPDFFQGRQHWKIIMVAMSLVSAAIFLYLIITAQFLLWLLTIPLLINGLLLSLLSRSIKEYFIRFGSKTKQFKKYAALFAHINKHSFSSTEIAQLQSECINASKAFDQLFKLSNMADQRLNGLAGPFMNGFFLFDLWCIFQIEKWRLDKRNAFPGWIHSLVTIDAISSFANFTFNHPTFTSAVIRHDKNFIAAKEMAHPLLNDNISIKNNYEIGVASTIHVITGSNMAGKSTFIRALGLNLILARNGSPVCATEFKCSPLGLVTSIRISDSLEENASYFKAELTRLEQLLDQFKTGQPYLVLLDEILRGTNSDDKRMGTQAFLLKLKQFNCLVLLATHDLSIGKMEGDYKGVVENYCFESQFVGDDLSFDYKLKKGVSSSTNATFLMKKMGLID